MKERAEPLAFAHSPKSLIGGCGGDLSVAFACFNRPGPQSSETDRKTGVADARHRALSRFPAPSQDFLGRRHGPTLKIPSIGPRMRFPRFYRPIVQY